MKKQKKHKNLSLKQYTEQHVVWFFWENNQLPCIIVKLMKQLLFFFPPIIWSQIQDISYLDVNCEIKEHNMQNQDFINSLFPKLISYITHIQNIQPHKHSATCLFVIAPTTNNYSTLNKVYKSSKTPTQIKIKELRLLHKKKHSYKICLPYSRKPQFSEI